MSASLVGSEMCIRDRTSSGSRAGSACFRRVLGWVLGLRGRVVARLDPRGCLLYTSDAADDM
eukprot:9572615-Alexandrium_andersonii.AAC.1